MKRALRGGHRRDEGAAAVEFALVLLILIPLVFGIIAFGIVLAQKLSLSNSSRQAARFVVTQDRTCADVMDEVARSATSIAMAPSNVRVTVSIDGGATLCGPQSGSFNPTDAAKKPCAGTPANSSIKVRPEYTSSLVIPLFVVDNSFDISAEGVFRCEYR